MTQVYWLCLTVTVFEHLLCTVSREHDTGILIVFDCDCVWTPFLYCVTWSWHRYIDWVWLWLCLNTYWVLCHLNMTQVYWLCLIVTVFEHLLCTVSREHDTGILIVFDCDCVWTPIVYCDTWSWHRYIDCVWLWLCLNTYCVLCHVIMTQVYWLCLIVTVFEHLFCTVSRDHDTGILIEFDCDCVWTPIVYCVTWTWHRYIDCVWLWSWHRYIDCIWLWLCLNTFLLRNDTKMVTVAIITTRPHMNIHEVKFAWHVYEMLRVIYLYYIGWPNKVKSLFWLFTYLKHYKLICMIFCWLKETVRTSGFHVY